MVPFEQQGGGRWTCVLFDPKTNGLNPLGDCVAMNTFVSRSPTMSHFVFILCGS